MTYLNKRRTTMLLLAFSLLVSCLFVVSAQADEPTEPAKLHLAAVYGGAISEKGKTATNVPVSHSFVEIYNPNDEAVNLEGYSLHYQGYPTQYKDRRTGETWATLALDGNKTIPARCSYLVNAGLTDTGDAATLVLESFDQVWENPPAFVTKGAKYVLTYGDIVIPADTVNPFDLDGAGTKLDGYIDMLGTAGNDVDKNDQIDGYERAYPGGDETGSSKQKGYVRSDRNVDRDNNLLDFRLVDFRNPLDEVTRPRSLADGPYRVDGDIPITADMIQPVAPVTFRGAPIEPDVVIRDGDILLARDTDYTLTFRDNVSVGTATIAVTGSGTYSGQVDVTFNIESALPPTYGNTLHWLGSYAVGKQNADGGVAEIVQYNSDNQKMYLVSGDLQALDIVSLADIKAGEPNDFALEKRVFIGELGSAHGFSVGDMTSVAVNTKRDVIAVSVQNVDYAANGVIVFLDYDGNYLTHVECGVQPDMITFTPDGQYALTANEGEPREGYETGVDPKGSVTIVDLRPYLDPVAVKDLASSASKTVDFTSFDDRRAPLVANGVLLKTGTAPSLDLEPEYLAISEDSKTAYVALQENNAVAMLDIESARFTDIRGLGFKDHNVPGNEIDLNADGHINIKSEAVFGVKMPDGLATVTIGGTPYLLTPNEGDAREWGTYENVHSKIINGSAKKVECLINTETDGLEADKTYLLGARSFSVYEADTMTEIYDSGSDFERITAEVFPTIFNAHHKNNKMEKRSNKKGPEPEDVKVLEHEGAVYAFVGLERIGGVMMYDISDPHAPIFIDYFNRRDPDDDGLTAGDLGAEGLATIPANLSPTGRPMLLVANEVSGTVTVLDFAETTTVVKPTLVESNVSYIEGSAESLTVVFLENDATLESLVFRGRALLPGTDYLVDGERITLLPAFLNLLTQGSHQLRFDTDGLVDPILTLTVNAPTEPTEPTAVPTEPTVAPTDMTTVTSESTVASSTSSDTTPPTPSSERGQDRAPQTGERGHAPAVVLLLLFAGAAALILGLRKRSTE